MSPAPSLDGALPVARTFIHFSDGPATVRARSAPPEAFVDWVVAEAIARERIGERRREKKAKRLAKKWARLLELTWEVQEREAMEAVRDVLAQQLLRTTPRLRVRLSTSLYKEFAHIMFPEKVQEALLWKMGVLRQRADEVQIWCADEPLQDSTMALLLDYARRFCEIAEARSFQVHMKGETPLVLKLQGVKKEDVRKVVERRWRIPSPRQALLHLGRLLKNGNLEDQGIPPGGCVQVVRAR